MLQIEKYLPTLVPEAGWASALLGRITSAISPVFSRTFVPRHVQEIVDKTNYNFYIQLITVRLSHKLFGGFEDGPGWV